MITKSRSLKNVLRASSALIGLAAASLLTTPAQAVVGNNNYPQATLVDPTNITGVGQMVIDQGGGYVGLCTVSLINPRTVIFAAHCVNEEPATSYGAAFGGTPIGFGFQAYNRTPLINWLYGDYATSTADAFYNSNYVIYNTASLDLGANNNFLQADIAMAALDTPATGIPTWTLLFSPLTSATHATIEGYGNRGTGTTGGSGGIDFRRRVAENTISMLGSLDDVDGFLFGGTEGLPQNLYLLDFNDPNFGTAQANAYDFNIFHDAALTKEAITAPGDSGGPLIVDQLFSKSVIAAVLSGGSRYFSGQPSSSYGTTSFYQPLYLFWDWIVTNNPYKYVSAKAGDGSWTDPSHWVINLDPNYVTTVNGQLVNALPTTAAQGTPAVDGVNTPKFGEVCYFADCYNVATGVETIYSTDASGSTPTSSIVQSSPAQVAIADIVSDGTTATLTSAEKTLVGQFFQSLEQTAASEGGVVINGQTVQGAPGSSNFVPNDTDGDPTTGAPARYYDVTLSAAGTTTLSNATIVIDRLTINGANTGLTIAATGALGTMIDTTVYAGNFQVNGLYVSNGDIGLLGGVLSGTGRVVAPYTTAVLGAFAPGTVGTTGTLTIVGDVIMSSGSGFLADVSATGSDLLNISGTAAIGGTLVVSPVGGYIPKWHQTKTVLAAGSITGSFAHVPDTIAGVLYPTVGLVNVGSGASAYQTEVVTFQAAPFSSQFTTMTDDQSKTGALLDAARNAHYADMSSLYDAIDPLTDGPLGAALENLAPDAARALPQVSQLITDAYSGFMWNYLGGMTTEGEAKVAVQTGALKLAMNSSNGSYEMRNLLSNLSSINNVVAGTEGGTDSGGTMTLPKSVGVFLSGQKLDGAVSIGGSGGKADVDGFLIALGADVAVTPNFRAGLSMGFGEAQADLRATPATTKTTSKQLALYGKYMTDAGYFVDGYVGGMLMTASTQRVVVVGGSTFNLKGHTNGGTPIFGVQTGIALDGILGGQIKPAMGLQYGKTHVAGYSETGGAPALSMLEINQERLDARFGFDADWTLDVGSVVLKPDLHAFLVTSIDNAPNSVGATFVAAGGSPGNFNIAHATPTWAEVGVNLEADVYDNTVLGFHFNATPGRSDASFAAFGGSLRVKF